MNLLHEFWNRKSDACPLEASEQEKQEQEFEIFINERNKNFEAVVKPVIKFLNTEGNPHNTILINCISAELLEGQKALKTEEFLQD